MNQETIELCQELRYKVDAIWDYGIDQGLDGWKSLHAEAIVGLHMLLNDLGFLSNAKALEEVDTCEQ